MALSITKATVGGSEDTWGTTTNTALDDIVSEINNNADGTNATTPNMTSLQIGGVAMTSTADELNILDGATITTDEINILDGDTSASTVTVEGTDGIILNDAGTMKQIDVDTLNTYIQGQAGGLSDVVGDTTPQLGGNLDLNSQDITGTGNINITGGVTATAASGITLGGWTIYVSGTDLKFKYSGTDRFKLTSGGELTVEDNVTAYGSA
jgi:hypothetical protein